MGIKLTIEREKIAIVIDEDWDTLSPIQSTLCVMEQLWITMFGGASSKLPKASVTIGGERLDP